MSRGTLHIASTRAPYRRAGLAWSTKGAAGAQAVDIRTLDGSRLLAIARDPVLGLQAGEEDGVFQSVVIQRGPVFGMHFKGEPLEFSGGDPAEQCQRVIDYFVEQLGPLDQAPAETSELTALGVSIAGELLERVEALGIPTGEGADDALRVALDALEEARTRLQGQATQILKLGDDLAAAHGELAECDKQAAARIAELQEANARVTELATRIGELETELQAAKSATAAGSESKKARAETGTGNSSPSAPPRTPRGVKAPPPPNR